MSEGSGQRSVSNHQAHPLLHMVPLLTTKTAVCAVTLTIVSSSTFVATEHDYHRTRYPTSLTTGSGHPGPTGAPLSNLSRYCMRHPQRQMTRKDVNKGHTRRSKCRTKLVPDTKAQGSDMHSPCLSPGLTPKVSSCKVEQAESPR